MCSRDVAVSFTFTASGQKKKEELSMSEGCLPIVLSPEPAKRSDRRHRPTGSRVSVLQDFAPSRQQRQHEPDHLEANHVSKRSVYM